MFFIRYDKWPLYTKPIIEALEFTNIEKWVNLLGGIIFSLFNAILITVTNVVFEKGNSSIDTETVNYVF